MLNQSYTIKHGSLVVVDVVEPFIYVIIDMLLHNIDTLKYLYGYYLCASIHVHVADGCMHLVC